MVPMGSRRLLPLERPEYTEILETIRNMWEFCSFVQFMSFFSTILKVESEFGVEAEVIEEDLLGVNDPAMCLDDAKRAMVHLLLDARFRTGDINKDIWKIYQRKSKRYGADTTNGIFGQQSEESGAYEHTFHSLDVPNKIKILAQLSIWTAMEERFREKLDQVSATQEDYRIGPVGWSGETGKYYLFDDNRLYYKEDFEPVLDDAEAPKLPPPPRKKKPAKKARGGRVSRRRRVAEEEEEEDNDNDELVNNAVDGGVKVALSEALAREYEPVWKCVAWNVESWEEFLEQLRKSRDADEKALYKYLSKGVIDVIREADVEKRQAAIAREKSRELAIQVAHRKTSTRLAQKRLREEEQDQRQQSLEREYQDEDSRRLQRRRLRLLEDEREKRLLVRQAREEKRQIMLAGVIRRSTRMQKAEDEKWYFDCICGVHGENYDDGDMSVACEQCNTWMHVGCLSPEEQDIVSQEGTEFICYRCNRIEENRRKEEARKKREEELAQIKQAELAKRRAQAAERKRQREEEARLRAAAEMAAPQKLVEAAAAASNGPVLPQYPGTMQRVPQSGVVGGAAGTMGVPPGVNAANGIRQYQTINGAVPGPRLGTFETRPSPRLSPQSDANGHGAHGGSLSANVGPSVQSPSHMSQHSGMLARPPLATPPIQSKYVAPPPTQQSLQPRPLEPQSSVHDNKGRPVTMSIQGVLDVPAKSEPSNWSPSSQSSERTGVALQSSSTSHMEPPISSFRPAANASTPYCGSPSSGPQPSNPAGVTSSESSSIAPISTTPAVGPLTSPSAHTTDVKAEPGATQ